jgi:ribonuclease Z
VPDRALKVAFSADINARIEETGGVVPPAAGAEVNAHEIRSGVVYERDGLRVSAIQVEHRAIAPAYGYRIDYGSIRRSASA